MIEVKTRAGMVAIVGLPNAGKSSLLNRFLGSKLSIVTAAAQTPRERVVGIDTRDDAQIVFLDTPGVVDPAYLLHHALLGIVEQSIADSDLVLLLLDGTRPPPEIAPEIEASLKKLGERLIIAVNKVDASNRAQTDALIAWTADRFGSRPHLVSAQTGDGVEHLRFIDQKDRYAVPHLIHETTPLTCKGRRIRRK